MKPTLSLDSETKLLTPTLADDGDTSDAGLIVGSVVVAGVKLMCFTVLQLSVVAMKLKCVRLVKEVQYAIFDRGEVASLLLFVNSKT